MQGGGPNYKPTPPGQLRRSINQCRFREYCLIAGGLGYLLENLNPSIRLWLRVKETLLDKGGRTHYITASRNIFNSFDEQFFPIHIYDQLIISQYSYAILIYRICTTDEE